MFSAAIQGFFLGLSLIVAIGAQNAFVLKQGLKGQHVFWVCLICALSDAILIAVGVFALHIVESYLPQFVVFARYFGALFLVFYGLRSFISAYQQKEALEPDDRSIKDLSKVLLICLALTWLNPHVYLDTVILLGSISTKYGEHSDFFALGAIISSFAFFFTLGYGSRVLRPLFSKPKTWSILDVLIGIVMWLIAYSLIF